MSIGQTTKHIGTVLLITLAVAAHAQQAQTYEVAGCEFLNMREGPASTYPINQRLQSGVNGIVLIGKPVFNGAIKWQQVNSRGVIGWVNACYLKRLAPPKTTAGSHLSASEVAAYNARVDKAGRDSLRASRRPNRGQRQLHWRYTYHDHIAVLARWKVS